MMSSFPQAERVSTRAGRLCVGEYVRCGSGLRRARARSFDVGLESRQPAPSVRAHALTLEFDEPLRPAYPSFDDKHGQVGQSLHNPPIHGMKVCAVA